MKWNPNQLLRSMLTFGLFPTIQNQHFCTHSFICPLDILMCSQWPTNTLCFIFTTLSQYISIPIMSFCICSWVLIDFFYVCLFFFGSGSIWRFLSKICIWVLMLGCFQQANGCGNLIWSSQSLCKFIFYDYRYFYNFPVVINLFHRKRLTNHVNIDY